MNLVTVSGTDKSGRTTVLIAMARYEGDEGRNLFFWSYDSDRHAVMRKIATTPEDMKRLKCLWFSSASDIPIVFGDIALFVSKEGGRTIMLDGFDLLHRAQREQVLREIEHIEKQNECRLYVIVTGKERHEKI